MEFFAQEYVEGYEAELSFDFQHFVADLVHRPEPVVYLAIQGLSNVKALFDRSPELKALLPLVHMGLSTRDFINWTDGGTNMAADAHAAKSLYSDPDVSIRAVGSQTSIHDELRFRPNTPVFDWLLGDDAAYARFLSSHLKDFYRRRGFWPALHDPIAAAVAAGAFEVKFREVRVDFDEVGRYRNGSAVAVTTSEPFAQPATFYDWFSRMVIG